MGSPAFFPHYWNIPFTLIVVQGEKNSKTELGFPRSGNRCPCEPKHAEPGAGSVYGEVTGDVQSCPWDATSTELRMSSLQNVLDVVLRRKSSVISAS